MEICVEKKKQFFIALYKATQDFLFFFLAHAMKLQTFYCTEKCVLKFKGESFGTVFENHDHP